MQGRLTAAACFAACLAAAIEARATHVCPGRPNGTVDFGPFPDPPFQHAHAIGAPCPDASATAEAGAIALAGGGFDIGQDGDQLLFAYSVAPGDFSARVTVAAKNLVPGSRWGKFGIMARQDCSDRSRYTLIHDCGENLEDNTRLSHRPTHGGSDNFETVPAGNFKHARTLRLDRRGGVFTAYVLDETGDFGTAPGTWLEVGRNDWGFTAPPAVLLGLAVSSHSECAISTVTFRDWKLLKPPTPFRRGDANADGRVSVLDAIHIAAGILDGNLPCLEAADANDDGALSPADATILLEALFGISSAIPPPGDAACELDPRDGLPGSLGCAAYPPCSDSTTPPDHPGYALSLGPPSALGGTPGGMRDIRVPVVLQVSDPVKAWSLAVRSDWPVTDTSTAGTAAAPASSEPQGRLTDGFHRSRFLPSSRGVEAATALSVSDPSIELEAGVVLPVLELSLESATPFGGCAATEIAFQDAIGGGPGENAVLGAGGAFRPLAPGAKLASCCPEGDLAYGTALTVTLTVASPAACFRLPPPPPSCLGKAVLVTLSCPAAAAGAWAGVYAAWGERATPLEHDAAAAQRLEEQSLVLPFAPEAPLALLVVGDAFLADAPALEATLQAVCVEAAVTGMTPSSSSPGVIHASVSGGPLGEGMAVALVSPAGDEIPAAASRIAWADRIDADFDLTAAPAGEYDLILSRAGRKLHVRRRAFALLAKRGEARLEVTLKAPPSYRNGELSGLILRYGNTGCVPVAAPLLQVDGPANAVFSLGEGHFTLNGRDDFHPGKIQLIGIDAAGRGEIAPGAFVVVPIYFQLQGRLEDGARVDFRVSSLEVEDDAGLDLTALPRPAALTEAEWARVTSGLVQRFGRTWRKYEAGLGSLAATLALRGQFTISVADVFGVAALEAFGEETASIAGQAFNVDGHPLRGARVVAREGAGAPAAVSLALEEGRFALNWLAPRRGYRVEVDGYELQGGPVVALAAAGIERQPITLIADRSTIPALVGCPGCEPVALAGEPPAIPRELLLQRDAAHTRFLSSRDPNSKSGEEVEGDGDPFGAARPGEELTYEVHFENVAGANAAAKNVVITDLLDPKLDGSSLLFLEAGFGVDAEGHRRSFQLGVIDGTRCDGQPGSPPSEPTLPPIGTTSGTLVVKNVCATVNGRDYCVRVRAERTAEEIDGALRYRAKWVFETFPPSCDPAGAATLRPDDGFLPRDDGNPDTHESEGFVRFSVKVREDLQGEGDIVNTARIKFDDNEVVETDPVVTHVSLAPEPPAHPSPPHGAAGVPAGQLLSWDPTQFAEQFKVYLWRSGEPKPPPSAPTATVTVPEHLPAQLLRRAAAYRWQVVAVSRTGAPAAGPEWSFETEAAGFVRGDSNRDQKLDLSDGVFTLNYLFQSGAPPQCEDAADANDDAGVDISDAVFFFDWLFKGGRAPPPPSVPALDDFTCSTYEAARGQDPTPDDLDCAAPPPQGCP